MTMFKLPLDARLLRDYIERRLDPREEQAFEEAIIADPELAEQVRLEIVMREGMAELARRERPGTAPRSVPHQPRADAHAQRHRVRGGRRWVALAAAAVLALGVGVPTALMLMRDDGMPGGPSIATVDETPLDARIVAGGQLASYTLPGEAPLATGTDAPQPEDGAAPLRLRLPRGVSEIVLELPGDAPATPHRLVLSRPDRPEVSVALAATTLPDAAQPGFVLGTEQLPPGTYRAQLERLDNGAWVRDREFVLRVDEGR